jgi:hypothetical protein
LRLRRAFIAAALGVAAAASLAPASAMASTAQVGSKTYRATQSFYSVDLNRCFVVTIYGRVQYRINHIYNNPWRVIVINDRPTLVNPVVTAKSASGARCATPAKLTELELVQRWYDYRCDFDPGISVGYPWSVSVQPTLDCGRVKVAQRRSTFQTDGSSYRQASSGQPVRFDQQWLAGKTYCMKADVLIHPYVGRRDDHFARTFTFCI